MKLFKIISLSLLATSMLLACSGDNKSSEESEKETKDITIHLHSNIETKLDDVSFNAGDKLTLPSLTYEGHEDYKFVGWDILIDSEKNIYDHVDGDEIISSEHKEIDVYASWSNEVIDNVTYGISYNNMPSLIDVKDDSISADIKDGVTAIYHEALLDCNKLHTINLPSSITYIGEKAFKNCTMLKSFEMPSNLTTISANSFEFCWNIASISLNKKLNYIDYDAFLNCSNIVMLAIPRSVEEIKDNAFKGCGNLVEVYIPNNLIYMGSHVFDGSSLATINCEDKEKPKTWHDEWQVGSEVIWDAALDY